MQLTDWLIVKLAVVLHRPVGMYWMVTMNHKQSVLPHMALLAQDKHTFAPLFLNEFQQVIGQPDMFVFVFVAKELMEVAPRILFDKYLLASMDHN